MENQIDSNLKDKELALSYYGKEVCQPLHSFGPAIRDVYLIHFIKEGKGKFHVDGKEYSLKRGQGFIIYPNRISHYQADQNDPWVYSWVGFVGKRAEEILNKTTLTFDSPIFEITNFDRFERIVDSMKEIENRNWGYEESMLGRLLEIFGEIINDNPHIDLRNIDETTKAKRVYERSLSYIAQNYSSRTQVNEIADAIGVNRSYLYNIFMDEIKMSPQDFIINFRMNKAAALLSNSDLSIGDIARSVGYSDQLMFSKIFKKRKGNSPTEYRKITRRII